MANASSNSLKTQLPFELVYQVVALIVAVILVHLVYITVIRPNADAILAAQAERAAQGEEYIQDRSLYVVLKDFEQEACFVLMIWAMAIMGYKGRAALRERALLSEDVISVSEGMSILPEDTREYTRGIQALPSEVQNYLLPRALMSALQRFSSTRNVQDVSEAIKTVCEAEQDRLDSELSMVRYIAWAIPSIGFIGTVRGIGDALGQAYKAVDGDIAGVTASLGVAFNSTFTALVISIVLMFLMHQLQLIQERLVLDAQTYCDQRLLRHLQVRTQ
ncbi:MAG: MotA/TolQ/ExbB proton channel family protein [Gammaproteobacteria bacterium]|jgi:biopolymer transport protein ExbB/TolQ|nr:MAG: MotA/TolQ/ExbB proton channel family protein [Gammaproteobacteria bacterium]